jgi:hypothetical protein
VRRRRLEGDWDEIFDGDEGLVDLTEDGTGSVLICFATMILLPRLLCVSTYSML